jgi:hypothetical protein
MGQRHQVFLCLENKDNMNKALHIHSFGQGERTVYAYHHQWLYGVSAGRNLLKVLNFAKKASTQPHYQNIFDARDSTLSTNFATAKVLGNLMGLNIENGVYSNFTLMNNPDDPCENYMREEFDRGDNNDGITIIDTINMKYCFMAIGHGDSIMNNQEQFKPMSAEEYMRLYYPLGEQEWADKEIPKVVRKLKKFKVMTRDEVVEWFPKMASKVLGVEVAQV